MKRIILLLIFQLVIIFTFSQGIIIDHNCANLVAISKTAINNAKQNLHIAYEHTSHGSQLITGMTGLVGQTNLVGYKGDIYQWNDGVLTNNLDINDEFTGGGDLGHNGDLTWETNTRTYLNDPANSDINVVIWSWCGGVLDNTNTGIQTYLDAMNTLEQDFPNVKFVYMTGHADIWEDVNVKTNNQQIRDYCINNNKILFDFYDIETYNPDGAFFEFVNDDCGYYDQAGGTEQGNWATEWQDAHTEGVDWYSCTSAHSHSLNANRKAYAAWWLWGRLAGWDGISSNSNQIDNNNILVYPNPVNDILKLSIDNVLGNNVIEIIDVYGKLVKKIKINQANNLTFDISDLNKTIYFIKLNNYKIMKFIKN